MILCILKLEFSCRHNENMFLQSFHSWLIYLPQVALECKLFIMLSFFFQVAGCEVASRKIDEVISLDGETDQKVSSFSAIPDEFFEDMESVWKGRIKTIHINDVLTSVDKAAEDLNLAVGLFN
jgi:hypothetical protein